MLETALWENRFLEYMELLNWSPRTIEGYRDELRRFLAFLSARNVTSLGQINRDFIDALNLTDLQQAQNWATGSTFNFVPPGTAWWPTTISAQPALAMDSRLAGCETSRAPGVLADPA